jgi:hypothetical protein
MEADWEFEIGGGAPVIEAWWPGYVDLRQSPPNVVSIPEAAELPALADALVLLNSAGSPVWTSKCGFWTNGDAEQFDADEFDAPPGGTAHIHCCYIDLLPRDEEQWPSADAIAAACRSWIASLRAQTLGSCRADLVIRHAFTPPERTHLAVTAYLTGSGSTSDRALAALKAVLSLFPGVICSQTTLQ